MTLLIVFIITLSVAMALEASYLNIMAENFQHEKMIDFDAASSGLKIVENKLQHLPITIPVSQAKLFYNYQIEKKDRHGNMTYLINSVAQLKSTKVMLTCEFLVNSRFIGRELWWGVL
jgi:hypothetical protein